eukprot:COSAG02_NODE_12442_length_1544_cov_0.942561_2_plen_97_part_00
MGLTLADARARPRRVPVTRLHGMVAVSKSVAGPSHICYKYVLLQVTKQCFYRSWSREEVCCLAFVLSIAMQLANKMRGRSRAIGCRRVVGLQGDGE